MRLRLLFTALSVGIAAVLVAGAANAASISYFLDQSNTTSVTDPDGVFPDGDNYLTVTFADSGTVLGDIDVTVAVLDPFTGIKGPNFGIQTFSFNSTNSLSASDITGLPSLSWATNVPPPPQQADGFGQFMVEVADTGIDRQDPLSFSISIDGDSIYDYAVLSTGGAGEGHTYFAAHVAGFDDQAPGDVVLTSAWFGGSTLVPEPSTALLLLGGLSGLAVWRRRRLR
jgi:hypothetical protein